MTRIMERMEVKQNVVNAVACSINISSEVTEEREGLANKILSLLKDR